MPVFLYLIKTEMAQPAIISGASIWEKILLAVYKIFAEKADGSGSEKRKDN